MPLEEIIKEFKEKFPQYKEFPHAFQDEFVNRLDIESFIRRAYEAGTVAVECISNEEACNEARTKLLQELKNKVAGMKDDENFADKVEERSRTIVRNKIQAHNSAISDIIKLLEEYESQR